MKVQNFITLLIISWFTKEISSLALQSQVLDRSSFPHGFVFGSGISAFQTEGATSEGGKSPSIWDHFSHTFPERTNNQNADIAVDFYHRYKDDIKLMKDMNLDSFSFSISWARLIPSGKVKDGVNKEGVQFYKSLIDELIANGIQPTITLYHWDHPQALEDDYGGFLSPQIIEDFRNYARVCFENFGDKVKLWTTINEPHVVSVAGYDGGNKAVGRCSKWVNSKCLAGDSAVEPYIVAHHLLLSHAVAVQEFRRCDKTKDGMIGIVLSADWLLPYDTTSSADKEATQRCHVSDVEWFLNPVIYGDYPELMKKHKGNRLPSFTEEESKMLTNSSDFIGLNYYTSNFVAHLPDVDPARARMKTDFNFEKKLTNRSNHYIGPGRDRGLLYSSYPEGLRILLNHFKKKYNNPIIYIKENGICEYDDGKKSREEILKDTFRIRYLEDHLTQIQKAIMEDGCDVRGYYTWSFIDNFEWEHGYTFRFGLYYVDYDNDLKRYPKDSVNWYKQFLKKPIVKSEESSSETSIDSIVNLMTNGSRLIEEKETDLCPFEKPNNDQFGFLLKPKGSSGF